MLMRDLYWAVGFIEGEGTFYTGDRSYRVSAPQVQLWPLEKLQRLFGGKIAQRGVSNINEWRLEGRYAIGFILTIYDLLSPRRRVQAMRVLEHWRERSGKFDYVCKRGHLKSDENSKQLLRADGSIHLECRICKKIAADKRTERLRVKRILLKYGIV
jgi:hypothetical protein